MDNIIIIKTPEQAKKYDAPTIPCIMQECLGEYGCEIHFYAVAELEAMKAELEDHIAELTRKETPAEQCQEIIAQIEARQQKYEDYQRGRFARDLDRQFAGDPEMWMGDH